DAEGKAKFGRLLLGEYKLKEVNTPDGFVGYDEQTIKLTEAYDPSNPIQTYTIKVENYEPIHAVEFVKVDSEDSNTVLEGAEFEIRGSSGDYVKTATSDENGYILFKDLPGAGTYTVKETKRPENYQLNEMEHTV